MSILRSPEHILNDLADACADMSARFARAAYELRSQANGESPLVSQLKASIRHESEKRGLPIPPTALVDPLPSEESTEELSTQGA